MEKTKYKGQFIKVTEESLEGQTWERVYLKGGVQVFPITDEGKIIMIEERRPHEKKKIRLKFVTGLIDNNEDPLVAANREMQEEIGYKSSDLEVFLHRESTGTVNNQFYQILAKGLIKEKIPNPDGEETIVSIKEYTLNEIEQFLYEGKLTWGMGALVILKLKYGPESELRKNLLSR